MSSTYVVTMTSFTIEPENVTFMSRNKSIKKLKTSTHKKWLRQSKNHVLGQEDSILKMSVFLRLTCRFNGILISIPKVFHGI